ncbi:MAG: DUF2089 domain-containing protein [Actinomycetota bacterium]|nr:DUF2089 domain-containing protein [Actinomycetota bacterium]
MPRTHDHTNRRPPRHCPVCSEQLVLTRLSCPSCATELSGQFTTCEFCSLSADDRELLGVFLSSRGNLKEVQAHLGVSYPTARARFDDLLGRLDLRPTAPPPAGTVDILDALRRGEIDVVTAEEQLAALDDTAS